MGIKVFGIGLSKTGTTTLAQCLKALGARHMSVRGDLMQHLLDRNFDPIWAVLDAHDSFEDWPYPLMYREIYARYGDQARFVLTVRQSADVWLDSLKAHSLTTHPTRHFRKVTYGYNFPHGYEGEHLAFYTRHNAGVHAFFAENGATGQLIELCWEKGDGWAEFCGFLGARVPDIPFPAANTRTERLQDVDPEWRAQNQRLIDAQLKALNQATGGGV